MGIVVLLNLVVKIFDVLAWPLITLVYPLYASIWAIENNSNSDNRKCLTYWVLYSLIWLFELSFSTFIKWLPFWPYMKLMATCCLVVPNLDGAAYVYDHFLRPCFPMTMQALNRWFIQLKENFLFSRSDNFLDEVERYIKENGHEALEKLINSKSKGEEPNLAQTKIKAVVTSENKEATATKWPKCEEPNLAGTEIKAVVTTENKEAAATEWLKSVEPNSAWTEKEACTTMEDKEMTAAVAEDRGIEVPNLTAPKDVKKEWSCALCQVSVSCEAILNDHFGGKKHQAKQRKLNESKMADKSEEGSSASTAKKDDEPKVEPKKGVSASGPNPMYVKKQEVVEINETGEQSIKSEKKQMTIWCDKCNIYCPSEVVMISHLNGKKHLAKLNQHS